MINYAKNHPRFSTSVAVTFLLPFVLPQSWSYDTRLLVAWDIGTAMYMALAARMMTRSDMAKIRQRAEEQYEGKMPTLMLTTFAAVASLVAIVQQLAIAKGQHGYSMSVPIALAAATVLLSWMFMQGMWALHYAHEYYISRNGEPARGLDFPGDEPPDYWDFVYFSVIIGASAQTADVAICSKDFRRIVTMHSTVAFFFNAIILSLTISIGAGLFG